MPCVLLAQPVAVPTLTLSLALPVRTGKVYVSNALLGNARCRHSIKL